MKTLTKTYLETLIKNAEYIRHENSTLTICVLTLNSGFVVTGESACISPENFDAEIGRKIAYDDAFEKLWQLEGYHQKALLAQVNLAEQTEFSFGQALAMLKLGYRVARKGWNGKGLSIELQTPDENSKMTLPYLFINYPATPASDTAPANHINARAPWLASQTDMLAEDWVLVE